MVYLLSTNYWPNLQYCYYLLNKPVAIIHDEHYVKQSFRNRTQITGANGVQNLIIPVKKHHKHTPVNEIYLSFEEKWQLNHWRAITSAYGKSPFFEFLEDDIKPFYTQKTALLIDYNTNQLHTILKILRVQKEIHTLKMDEVPNSGMIDLRETIHPKKQLYASEINLMLDQPYFQSFQNKHPFMKNLSILDLLFSIGLDTKPYLSII